MPNVRCEVRDNDMTTMMRDNCRRHHGVLGQELHVLAEGRVEWYDRTFLDCADYGVVMLGRMK